MQPVNFAKALALVLLGITAFAFRGGRGLDSFEIYLNKQLILQQTVNQPLSLRKLALDKADAKDQLTIKYVHCHKKDAGTGRSISLKDDKGQTLKTWKFADEKGTNAGMVIPVKELLALEKSNAGKELSLYYASQELPKAEMLASFNLGGKSTTYNSAPAAAYAVR